MKFKYSLILLFIISSAASIIRGQILNEKTAAEFTRALINESDKLPDYLAPVELQLCQRLGISYKGVEHKFLISNDIPDDIRKNLVTGNLKNEFELKQLGGDYSLLLFKVPSEKLQLEYYFYKGKLVSKPYYYGRDWSISTSRYFYFHVSDTGYFNRFSIDKLDKFTDSMLVLLKFSPEDIVKLQKQKIHYYLCRGETEVEQLSGYKARGLYYIPYDYILTSYNCHYHELLHLLINYRLNKPGLYTSPFLQEGFAVAFGGRGGMDPAVIFNMGSFLALSGFMDYKELLSKTGFTSVDASLSYPVSGLYVKFLIEKKGVDYFINLYRKYTGTVEKVDNTPVSEKELPAPEEWSDFVKLVSENNPVRAGGFSETDYRKIKSSGNLIISESDDEYLFQMKDTLLLLPDSGDVLPLKSRMVEELCPGRHYNGEKFLVTVSPGEISIYNLYTNNLCAKYVRGFSPDNEPVAVRDGCYTFAVKKEIFKREDGRHYHF